MVPIARHGHGPAVRAAACGHRPAGSGIMDGHGTFPPIRRVGHKRLVLRQDLEEFIAGSWQPPEATNGR
jgi:hypothetical protein